MTGEETVINHSCSTERDCMMKHCMSTHLTLDTADDFVVYGTKLIPPNKKEITVLSRLLWLKIWLHYLTNGAHETLFLTFNSSLTTIANTILLPRLTLPHFWCIFTILGEHNVLPTQIYFAKNWRWTLAWRKIQRFLQWNENCFVWTFIWMSPMGF